MFIKSTVSVILLAAAFSLMSADWPAWRGEKSNGTTTETINGIGDAPLWELNVGAGYSAVSVYKGKLLTAGNKNDQDVIYCLDPATGKEIWNYAFDCAATKNYPGPRATPVTDGKSVYMVSRNGDLICVDLDSGKLKWEKRNLASGDVENLKWGLASSVLLYDNMAIVNIGGKGMAFDAATGKPVWQSVGQGNYSTPVVFAYKGKDYLAIFSAEKLLILEPRTGNEIASYEWITKYNVNAADPVVFSEGGKILISSGYSRGSALLSFDGKELKKIWESKTLSSHFTTPILIDGTVYGVNGTSNGNFCAIKLADGTVCWKSPVKFGSFIQAGDKFVYIEDNGTLNLIKPSAQKCEVLKTVKIPKLGSAKCWTMPVLAEGKIYCRNANGQMACFAAK